LSKALTLLKKYWFTFALLIGTLFAVNWFVTHKRAPGSMTVIEAQSMDMTNMKAPVGTQPVSIETVSLRSLQGGKSFPGVVSALTDEDVVARIPGKVSRILVYPGDKVRAGQLLALLDAPEYEASLRKAQAMSGAKAAEVLSAEHEVDHHRNILSKANATIKASDIELQKAKEDFAAKLAEIDQQKADLKFAEQEFVRQQVLYKKGAISLEELQSSQKDRDSASAKVKSGEANARSSEQSVRVAEKRAKEARQMVTQSDAQVSGAQAEAAQAQEGIAQAHADASARRFESTGANAEASGASSIANYRELRALGAGVVAERVVSPGTAVASGQVVLKLQTLNQVRVQADVPQNLSASLHAGMSVRVVGDSFQKMATLSSVFPSVDPQTRTFRIEAILPNPGGDLKPGMFARIELDSSGDRELTVRTASIQSDDNGKFAWTVLTKTGSGTSDWTCTMHPEVSEKGPGKCPKCAMDLTLREKGGSLIAHRQTVTITRSGGDYTVVASGLREGDKVIWAGFENLIEGSPVQDSQSTASTPKTSPIPMSDTMPGMDMGKGK
jgi:multidrug efflux pump subunit AcrA (membrane-fusion protein)